ncbi:MAG TPA: PIN domain-containing protein [Bacteroidia bacterium]|nr:PIN domain-containing protein [Bacteroidia bacterium]
MIKSIQIYLDTSVINFLFADDSPEKKELTIELFSRFIKTGFYESFISDFVIAEIEQTPDEEKKNKLLKVVEEYSLTLIDLTNRNEIEELAGKYMAAGIIPEKKYLDALHIATAVTKQIPYLVSWNYKHLANINKEHQVRIINMANNYIHDFRIITPFELMDYGN